MRKFEHREGKGGSLSSQEAKNFFPQHLVCIVCLRIWEGEVELISVSAVAVEVKSRMGVILDH